MRHRFLPGTGDITTASAVLDVLDAISFQAAPATLEKLIAMVELLERGAIAEACAQTGQLLEACASTMRISIAISPDDTTATPFEIALRRRMFEWAAHGSGRDAWGVLRSARPYAGVTSDGLLAALKTAAAEPVVWDPITFAMTDVGVEWCDVISAAPVEFSEGLSVGLVEQWYGNEVAPQWPFRTDWRAACGDADDPAGPLHQLAIRETLRVLGPQRLGAVTLTGLCRGRAAGVAEAAVGGGLLSTAAEATFEALVMQHTANLTIAELATLAHAAVAQWQP